MGAEFRVEKYTYGRAIRFRSGDRHCVELVPVQFSSRLLPHSCRFLHAKLTSTGPFHRICNSVRYGKLLSDMVDVRYCGDTSFICHRCRNQASRSRNSALSKCPDMIGARRS